MEKQKRVYKLISGAPLCERTRQIGYCWCDAHPGFLTTGLFKEHECLQKGCPFLERFKDHPLWIQKEKTKQKRNKAKQKQKLKAVILNRFRELTSDFEGFAVCDVTLNNNVYQVRCVTTQTTYLSDIIRSIAQEFKVRIKVSFVQNTFNARSELITIIKEREIKEKSA